MKNFEEGPGTNYKRTMCFFKSLVLFLFFLVPSPWSLVPSPSALAGEYDSQIAKQQKIINKDPTNLDATYQLGNLLAWDGRYDEAIRVYEMVLAKEPAYEEALVGMARAYAWKGDQQDAIKKYEAVLSKNPKNFEAYEGLGSLSLWINDFEKSIHYFKKSLELNPHDIISLKGIGRAYLGRGDRRTAEDYFTKAAILEIRQTPLATIVLLAAAVLCLVLLAVFFIRGRIRKKKEIFLKMELKILRCAVALYQQKKSRFPLALENLLKEGSYLEGFQTGDRGFLIDPFKNRYWYNPDTGKVTSTTKGCEEW